MNIIGIDPGSKRIAVAILDVDGEFTLKEFTTKQQERAEALHELTQQLDEYLREVGVDETFTAFVEQPLVGRGGAHATIVVSQTQGVILNSLLHCGVGKVYTCNVQTWKRETVGRGNAKKPDVHEWFGVHHPDTASVAGDNQDLVDAACIALYGRTITDRAARLPGVRVAETG